MKTLLTILVALIIGSSYATFDTSSPFNSKAPSSLKVDGPGTGNDGEDTSKRGFICRVFGVFC